MHRNLPLDMNHESEKHEQIDGMASEKLKVSGKAETPANKQDQRERRSLWSQGLPEVDFTQTTGKLATEPEQRIYPHPLRRGLESMRMRYLMEGR